MPFGLGLAADRMQGWLATYIGPELLDRGDIQPGDIIMARPGPQQQHLMIRTEQGYVHAHAGLRRVVLTPGPSPWPVIAGWRLSGG